jgi:serine/threonine protein kinase
MLLLPLQQWMFFPMAENSDQEFKKPGFDPDFSMTPFLLPSTDSAETASITRLGSGYITALLGKGGMANVYEIWNPELEIHRAVKLIHPTATDLDKERFETEMRITAKLHHPQIVEIHGVGKWNGLSYLEMEKLDGKTLKEFIEDRGALPIPVCTSIGIMICEALKHAHEMKYILYGEEYHGVIHRDLKPSNIMICSSGMVKLMDFGIARPVTASFHTTDGTVVGTIHYLPPEQLKGGTLDQRTDIYALATTLYETLTGIRAFPEKNLSKLMVEKTKNHFTPLHEFRVEIPGELVNVIHRCMHYNPDKRVASAQKLLERLEKIHKKLTPDSPQKVMKSFIDTRFSQRITPVTRNTAFRHVVVPVVLLIGFCIVSLISFNYYKTFRKNTLLLKTTAMRPPLSAQNSSSNDPLDEWRAQIDSKTTQKDRKKMEEKIANAQTAKLQESPYARGSQSTRISRVTIPVNNTSLTLQETYGTESMSEIMALAIKKGKYDDVIRAYGQLPAEKKSSSHEILLLMRSYVRQNNYSALQKLMNSSPVNDGEFLLEKGKQEYLGGNIQSAEKSLKSCITQPCQLLDRDELLYTANYYLALCETQNFESSPTDQTYKSAMESWYLVKTALKTNPNHAFFSEATRQMQKIGTLYKKIEY